MSKGLRFSVTTHSFMTDTHALYTYSCICHRMYKVYCRSSHCHWLGETNTYIYAGSQVQLTAGAGNVSVIICDTVFVV
jgi:hypothetical protein